MNDPFTEKNFSTGNLLDGITTVLDVLSSLGEIAWLMLRAVLEMVLNVLP